MAADLLLPLLFCGILCWGAVQGVDVFAAFRTGAARGLTAAGEILPSLIALVTAVAMLRASGALELLCTAFAPAAEQLGLPGELLPMALLRRFRAAERWRSLRISSPGSARTASSGALPAYSWAPPKPPSTPSPCTSAPQRCAIPGTVCPRPCWQTWRGSV
ncbi:MAG: hypothetical protein V8Q30_01240 [Acutalibacteraceae bacterium]